MESGTNRLLVVEVAGSEFVMQEATEFGLRLIPGDGDDEYRRIITEPHAPLGGDNYSISYYQLEKVGMGL